MYVLCYSWLIARSSRISMNNVIKFENDTLTWQKNDVYWSHLTFAWKNRCSFTIPESQLWPLILFCGHNGTVQTVYRYYWVERARSRNSKPMNMNMIPPMVYINHDYFSILYRSFFSLSIIHMYNRYIIIMMADDIRAEHWVP